MASKSVRAKVLSNQGSRWGVEAEVDELLAARNTSLEGRTAIVSGSGNLAIYAVEKLQQLGATVVACSDSSGIVHDVDGLNVELLKQVKEVERGRLDSYADRRPSARFVSKGNIWQVPCEVAIPSATQNELSSKDALALLGNGCIAVAEGANMPCTADAVDVFTEAKIAFGPGKAANADGVATSALEMQQNASRDSWSFEHAEGDWPRSCTTSTRSVTRLPRSTGARRTSSRVPTSSASTELLDR